MHFNQTGKFLKRIPYAGFGRGENPILVINGGQGFMMTPSSARMIKDIRRLARIMPNGRSFVLIGYDPDAAHVTVDGLADDVTTIIEQHFGGTADVMGISYGGVIAARAAACSPENVSRLVLLVSAPWFSDEGKQRIQKQIDLITAGEMSLLLREFTAMFRSRWLNTLMDLRVRLSADGMLRRLGKPDVILHHLRAMLECEAPGACQVRKETPTLMIGGSRDQFFAAAMMEASARFPHIEASIFPGETHMVPIERTREVRQVTAAFLQES
ncbi:alpha/beta hydrolase [Rhizobium sp. FKL33]|uniref:alpha/beta fold hydrolase n=1 Tax=Rhizobium sp. FKL33 TaxID=2562307 RepID=UPI0010BFC9E5|nr:alpha/beta hydrolase [Rhizobium sp. FKL33]